MVNGDGFEVLYARCSLRSWQDASRYIGRR